MSKGNKEVIKKVRKDEESILEYVEPKVYTVREAATLLQVGINRVYELINSGALRVIRLGYIKVPAEELDNFLERYTGKDLSDPNNIVDYLPGDKNDTEDNRKIS